jgi:hypothetical protein
VTAARQPAACEVGVTALHQISKSAVAPVASDPPGPRWDPTPSLSPWPIVGGVEYSRLRTTALKAQPRRPGGRLSAGNGGSGYRAAQRLSSVSACGGTPSPASVQPAIRQFDGHDVGQGDLGQLRLRVEGKRDCRPCQPARLGMWVELSEFFTSILAQYK